MMNETPSIWTRAGGAARLLAAAALAAGLVAGVPYLLLRFVGNPIPDRVPAWDEIVLAVQSRQVDDSVIVQVLAIVIWVVWAHLLVSFVVEAAAAARGAGAKAVRGLGATQWLARRLVAQFTLASTVFVQSAAGVVPVPAPPLSEIVPAEVIVDDQGPLGPVVEITPVASAASSATTEIAVGAADTLWDLAEAHLGSGSRWTEIRDINVGRTMTDGTVLDTDFVTITGEWTLLVPTEQTGTPDPGAAATPNSAGTVIGAWRVEPGDHFWMMAETVLEQAWGRAPGEGEIRGYWVDIIAHNRDNLISPGNDPNLIYADQSFEILLPPLPADPMSADDALATTSPHPLTGLDQFTPLTQPVEPPAPRAQETDPGTGSGSSSSEPVVEITRGEELPPPVEERGDNPPVTAPAASGGDGGLDVGLPAGWSASQVVGVGLSGLVAAALLNTLRGRRRLQAARRRPGSEPNLPDPVHEDFEARVRAIADHEALRWLTATNKFLSHTLSSSDTWALPAIVAVRAGAHGVEVLLDEDVAPPRGFIGGQQPRSWILDPDVELRQLESESQGCVPYAPALLPVGGTRGGELLVEFGQLGVISLDGPDEAILGWLRSLTVAVANSPWSERVRIIAVGVDPILERMPHVEVPDDPVEWARAEVQRHQAEGPRPDSRYEQRIAGTDVDETVVLVGPGHQGVAQHLSKVAELVNTPITLVAAAPVPGDARMQFDGDQCSLEPTGVTYWPSVIDAAGIAMTTTLLDQAADLSSVPEEVLYPPSQTPRATPEPAAPPPLVAPTPPIAPATIPEPDLVRFHPPANWAPPVATNPDGNNVDDGVDGPADAGETPPAAPVITGEGERPVEPVQAKSEPAAEDANEAAATVDPVADDPEVAAPISPAAADPATSSPGPVVMSSAESLVPPVPPVQPAERAAPEEHSGEIDVLDEELNTADAESVPLGECETVAGEIAALLAPQPVEVSLLRPDPAIEGTTEVLTPKNRSVLAFLAFRRSATSNTLRDVFWPSSVNRSTADNAISIIRRTVGATVAGVPRLELADGGRLVVSDEIGCDWTRFDAFTERATVLRAAERVADEIAVLRAGLGLVSGPIATEAPLKNWLWLRDDPMVYSLVETAVVDAAHRLGQLACAEGLAGLALWAAAKGLLVVPDQEALYRIQMEAAGLAGDQHAVSSVYRRAQRTFGDQPDGVQPETEVIYRRVSGYVTEAEPADTEERA